MQIQPGSTKRKLVNDGAAVVLKFLIAAKQLCQSLLPALNISVFLLFLLLLLEPPHLYFGTSKFFIAV